MSEPATEPASQAPLSPNTHPTEAVPLHEQGYRRLSPKEISQIYRLRHIEQFTIQAIADRLGRSVDAVQKYTAEIDHSTVEHAKRLLEVAAHPAAEVLVNQLESADERIQQGAASKVLTAAGLMTSHQVQVGVQVVLGTPDTPVSYDPFAPK